MVVIDKRRSTAMFSMGCVLVHVTDPLAGFKSQAQTPIPSNRSLSVRHITVEVPHARKGVRRTPQASAHRYAAQPRIPGTARGRRSGCGRAPVVRIVGAIG